MTKHLLKHNQYLTWFSDTEVSGITHYRNTCIQKNPHIDASKIPNKNSMVVRFSDTELSGMTLYCNTN